MRKKKSPTAKAIQQSFFEETSQLVHRTVAPQKNRVAVKSDNTEKIPASELGLNEDIKDFGIYILSIGKTGGLVKMEDKRLFETILFAYEGAFKFITRPEIFAEPVKVKAYLQERCMQYGICAFSRLVLSVSLVRNEYVNSRKDNGSMYWVMCPYYSFDSREMADLMKARIDKLKDILNEIEKNEQSGE